MGLVGQLESPSAEAVYLGLLRGWAEAMTEAFTFSDCLHFGDLVRSSKIAVNAFSGFGPKAYEAVTLLKPARWVVCPL